MELSNWRRAQGFDLSLAAVHIFKTSSKKAKVCRSFKVYINSLIYFIETLSFRDVTYHIDDYYGVFAEATGTFIKVGLVQLEGGHVWSKYRRVDHQYKDQPIPSGL